MGPDYFGNKVILDEGRISKFGTVTVQIINPTGLYDPLGQLYSDELLRYRHGRFRVRGSGDELIVAKKGEPPIRIIQSGQIHFVRDITHNQVTEGGWLARIDHLGEILPYDKRDLPLVREATRGVKPPETSERDFLRVNEKPQGQVMHVLEMGHPHFPRYQVFDDEGNPVSFWHEYPLSYSKWGGDSIFREGG